MKPVTNKRNVTIAVMIATFLAAIEGTIVSTAMPTIVSDLGGFHLISWVVSIYLLTSAVTTPIYGKLADLFGRKPVFNIGAILFLLGSALSGLSQTMEQLIWFRAFQGLGAGAIITITYTIVGDIYPFEERGKVQGWMSGIWGISGILGPLTGGLLVDYVSWHWIFYMNIPFGIVSIVLIWLYLHENIEKVRKHIDYAGAAVFTISVSALLYALLSGGTEHPWSSPLIVGLLIFSALGLLLFIYLEKRSPEPMLPLQLFTIRKMSIVNFAGFLLASVLVAVSFYLPLWIQGVYGLGATGSGLTLIPMSVGWPIGAALSGRLLAKIGIRPTSLFGVCVLIVATVWLSMIEPTTPHVMLYGITFLFGLGFGFAFTSFTGAVLSVSWNLRGVAVSTNSFIRTLGQTLGIALFGTLLNSYVQSAPGAENIDVNKILNPHEASLLPQELLQTVRELVAGGLHQIFVILLALAAVSLIVTLAYPREREQEAA
ncbi:MULTISPECIES: MDR family MFS transporter [Brevibacillus]|uniref:EmrB/QacA subfamily drug resistance transporter n=1 Tax=Brevibacillus borstelensis AK1 TaxID=1300222 RepID=M8DAR5_9BACL|nr:MDR family MFS transporter [Brevibacillus borstelensis]EMT50412.1 EmrB/QacA subfamily drug resistance transporter [Brevibacillus borstelensis AK1]KKX57076.1 DSBA oxidoreductase [Brevibacillus borstelensis cifa_chp40]MBE5395767.1 MFS transporter [Brevibacillus borstelensis]MED1744277.1 MDR family MFS transporter [Brevibacillus borstelensis]